MANNSHRQIVDMQEKTTAMQKLFNWLMPLMKGKPGSHPMASPMMQVKLGMKLS